MRNTFVPHFGQIPRVAGLPFFSVTFWGFLISTFALHLKQYACTGVTSFQTYCTITAMVATCQVFVRVGHPSLPLGEDLFRLPQAILR